MPPERVARLEFESRTPPTPVSGAGETRLGTKAVAGERLRVCGLSALAENTVLEIGVRSDTTGGLVRVHADGAEPAEMRIPRRWSDLVYEPPADAACVGIEIRGRPEMEAILSPPLAIQPGSARPWVVFYVVDTLRFDHTPLAGLPARRAPELAAFADESIVYRRAFSSSSWTRPSVATLLTGLGPWRHHVRSGDHRLASSIPRLPEVLQERGWHTVGLSTNPNVLPVWGFFEGFDRFVDVASKDWMRHENYTGLVARSLVEIRRAADRPLFLFVHDNQPHSPYRPPPSHRARFDVPAPGNLFEWPHNLESPGDMAIARRLYAAEISATSDRFGVLLHALREEGRYRDSIIVLVGDHGEEFGEHGGVYHGKTLFQEQLHVPLLVKPPSGRSRTGAVDVAVGVERLVATLTQMLAIEDPSLPDVEPLPLPGVEPRDKTVVHALLEGEERIEAAVRWPWKLLRTGGANERLYDLANDPEETRDVASVHPEVVAALRAAMDERRSAGLAGLMVTCLAGDRNESVRIEVELSPGATPVVEPIGLDPDDSLLIEGFRVVADLELRAALDVDARTALNPLGGVLGKRDRDSFRVRGLTPGRLRLKAALEDGGPVQVQRSDGSPLPTDGSPIAVETIATHETPQDHARAPDPVCRLVHRRRGVDQVSAEEIDPALRERLRHLGYVE